MHVLRISYSSNLVVFPVCASAAHMSHPGTTTTRCPTGGDTAVAAAAARSAELAEDHFVDLDEDPLPEMPRAEEVKEGEAHVAKPVRTSPDPFESASERECPDGGETEQDTAVAAPAQSSQDTAVAGPAQSSQNTAVPASSSCPHTAVAASSSTAKVCLTRIAWMRQNAWMRKSENKSCQKSPR